MKPKEIENVSKMIKGLLRGGNIITPCTTAKIRKKGQKYTSVKVDGKNNMLRITFYMYKGTIYLEDYRYVEVTP